MAFIKTIGKLAPGAYKQMIDHLTRRKIKNPFIKAEDIIVDKKPEIEQTEMFNRFNKANPRQDMADGGMLVQPSADGSRPGYSKSKMGKSKLGEGMENIFKEKIGPGKFRYSIQIKRKKYGQVIGEENLPALKKKRDQVIKKLYPNRITNEDFAKLKNLKKYENMDSAQFAKVLNDKGFTTISGKEWNQKSTLRKIDELDLELVGRKRSESEIFEIVKKIEGGPSKIKLYKEGIIPLKTLRDIATDYEKRQTPEYKETKKKIETKAKLKKAQTLGNFPPGTSPNDNLWAQVYRSAKDGDGRWKIVSKLPPLKDGKRDWVKNNSWKKMRVIDTQTGTEFGYKDLKNYLDNLEGPGTYDNALKPWQNKKDLNAIKINYRGDNVSLGKVLSNKKLVSEFINKNNRPPTGDELTKFYKERYPYGKNNFAVNHPEGVKNNWWNAEVVHKDANDRLERLDKSFRSNLNLAKNNVQRNRVIELYKKDVKKIGNVTSIFEGQTFGKSNILGATRDAFKTEGLSRTFEANRKQIVNQIAVLGGEDCGRIRKYQGGRIGLQDGTPNVDVCFKKAIQRINSGFKNATPAEARNYTKLLNAVKGSAVIGRNLLKFGIIPEALYVGADSLVRMGFGDTFKEAGLRASDFFIPGDQMQEADKLKVQRTLGDAAATNVGRVFDYRNQIANIDSLEKQKANLENLSDVGEFDYIGDLSQDVKNIDTRLNQAKNDLQNKFMVSEAETVAADQALEEAYDISKAKSPLARLKRFTQNIEAVQDDPFLSDIATPQKTQMDLNLNMFPTAIPTQTDFMKLTDTDIMNRRRDLINAGLTNLPSSRDLMSIRDAEIADREKRIDEFKAMPLMDAANQFGREQVFGTQGTFFGQPLAGGGIAKLAGDRSGPPPERGPNSQGLPGLLKRVRNL